MDTGRVSFGRFQFDTRLGRLTRDGHKIKLQPKPAAVLCRLLRNPGELASRDDLKKALWPEGTHVDFDLGIKVATQKLRAALGDGFEEPIYIQTIPGAGYRFIAPVTAVEPEMTAAPVSNVGPVTAEQHLRRHRYFFWAAGVAAFLGVVTLGIASLVLYSRSKLPEPVVTPFTTYPGFEAGPSFSPDGGRIAFTWNGPHEDNFDVYVKQIGPGDPQRLTSDPQADTHPKWSPDGKWIAFLRHAGLGTAAVMAIPAMGGPERKVGEADFDGPAAGTLDWSPDGQWLLITKRPSADRGTGLALLSFRTREIRQITSPTGREADQLGSFAPDGHALAFLRTRAHQRRLMVVAVSRSLEAVGQPAEFSFPQLLTSLCWTVDSRDIIFAASDGEASAMLWRMPASGKSSRRLLSYLGNANFPSVSRQGGRMAFVRRLAYEAHLWALELDASGQPTGSAQEVFESTWPECTPRFSPDGRKVVFQSERSGRFAIWVCETGGANCFPVSPPGPLAANPDWSPDGKWIAFNTFGESGSEIDLVRSDGAQAKLLTRGASGFQGAILPRWSHNGQWIYFNCGATHICRVASSGGEAQPVSASEGYFPEESPDGRYIYFITEGGVRWSRLNRAPVSGGAASEIVPQVAGRNWALTPTGIWFMMPPLTANGGSDLRYLDMATGATRTVFRTERPVLAGIAISPDQRRIIFSLGRRAIGEADIMLVEDFR